METYPVTLRSPLLNPFVASARFVLTHEEVSECTRTRHMHTQKYDLKLLQSLRHAHKMTFHPLRP